jgi:DNA-binding CsgD family transcriptional regulator/outer membrane lipoprotein-sorting protein
MTSAQVEHFATAKAHEHELNERQRRVLDLLVEGKTNGEIADALGITLDGAKWNVSEILGKLGLATREEAAEYWRWRNRHGRGALRALRGLAGPVALKWAAGAVAAVAVAAIAIGFFANEDREPAAPGEFYLEARIEVVDRTRDDGVTVSSSTPPPPDAVTTVSSVRWWSKDRDHARWEIDSQEDGETALGTTIVIDGAWQWVYSSATNTYSKSAIPELPDAVQTRPLAFGAFVGPVGAVSKQAFLDGLRELETLDFVREAGTATVLGRETTIIEFGPASRSSSQGSAPLGGPTPAAATQTSSGVVRVWLDEERMVAMRYVVEGSPAEVRAEVVRLDWDAPVPARRLTFEPPGGANLVDADTGPVASSHTETGSISGGGTLWYTTPPGFFMVTYLPAAFAARDYERQFDANNQPTRLIVTFAGAGPAAEMTVEQSRSSAPLPLRDEPMENLLVGGAGAFLAERAGDTGSGPEFALATRRDGINITITAHGLSREEVIAVAEGLELVR